MRFIKDQARTTGPFFLLIATKAVHGQGQEGKKEHAAIPTSEYENSFMDVKLPVGPAFNKPPRPNANATSLDKDILEKEYRAALQSLQSVDDLVEAVVNALQSSHMLDDTIIVYTSDNGFLFGDHGKRAKGVLFEGAIRVPLLIRGPGIPENETRDQLVNNLDVVATIEQLAGATPGLAQDGHSLTPLFANASAPWRRALLVETRKAVAVRTATRKYVKNNKGSEEELYDLISDPHELTEQG